MTTLSRLTRHLLPSFAILFAFTLCTGTVIAQNSASGPAWAQQDTSRITREVQKKLGSLSNLGVFDWITFRIQGRSIVLSGYASRPTLKSDAGRVLKNISGVESVDNQIHVIPFLRNDDRIRAAVYNRIYTQPALRIYNANQGTVDQAIGPNGRRTARMSGGITNYPPQGFNAIHIIVQNGNVTLYGVVNSESDKTIAGMQASSTPGVFKVINNLIVKS